MLITERLTLRGPEADDLDDMFAIFSNRCAMRDWYTPPNKMDGGFIGNAGRDVGTKFGFILLPVCWRKAHILHQWDMVRQCVFGVGAESL